MEDAIDKKVKVLFLWYSAEKSQSLKQRGELTVTDFKIEDVLGVKGIVLYNNTPELIASVKEVILGEQEREYVLRIDSLHLCKWPDVNEYLKDGEPKNGQTHKLTSIELDKTISLCNALPHFSDTRPRDFVTLSDATEMLSRTYGVSKEQVGITISNS